MKDYSELIRSLKHGPADYILVSEAATAIEQLQKERDEAIKEIEKKCANCKYLLEPLDSIHCNNCNAAFSGWEWGLIL